MESMNNIWFWGITLCGIGLLSKVLFRLNDYIELKFSPRLTEEISIDLFKYITNHSVSYFQNNFSGSITHKIKQISEITKYFLTFYTISILQIITVLIFSCGVIFQKSSTLGMFIFIFGLIYMYLSYIISKKNKVLAAEWSEQSSKVNGSLTDSIENMLLVKSLAKSEQEINAIKEHLSEEKNKLVELKNNMNKIKIFHVIVSSTIITVTLLSSIYLLINHKITIGDFFFIL